MFCKVSKKDRVMEKFRVCLRWECKCGIKVKDYDEARVLLMVTVKAQDQKSWLGFELLGWAVVQKA